MQRLRILKQFVDGESMTVLRSSFSIDCAELDRARAMLESMAKDLARSVFGRNMIKGAGPGQQPQNNAQQMQSAQQVPPQVAAQPQPQQSQQTAPLNAANLEKNSQALKAKAGKNFKVPNAPTTTQPPFSFTAPSPHGNPSYANAQDPPMELKIPPRKKSKVGGQGSQAATPSPQVSKASPPRPQTQEVQQPRPAEVQKPVLICKDPECEHSPTGYANEEALQKHINEEHAKPREDPLKFVQDNLALALGLEPDGTAKKDLKAAPPMVASISKQSLTLGKELANTPLSQDSGASMKRSASSQKEVKLANKADMKQEASAVPDPWANVTLDPKVLMTSLGLENGVHSVIFDPLAFRALTPEWTPESKDSGESEPTSDISEGAALEIDLNWQSVDTFDVDLLLDLDRTTLEGKSAPMPSFMDAPTEALTMDPSLLFTNARMEVPDWDEIPQDFSKPFELDTSLYSMDYTS